jgi:4-hydroxy-tetrahydrodipicolinate reductase
MIEVMVNGCNGKMGSIVCDLVDKDENMVLKFGTDKIDNGYRTFPVYTELGQIPEKPDVIIDFSIPVSTFEVLEYAKKNNVPIVIATTGFTGEEEKKIAEYSNYIPVFKSANMSFSINMFQHLLKEIAPKLADTDIEIIESHHNRKIDSPSGTAQMLADTINEALGGGYVCEYDRHSKHEKRGKNEIGMTSIRGGNIVGEHTVKFFGESETFEITHTSYSRQVFAEGAIKAANFIANKEKGLYNMDDLVK